jgi:hypothetical protein
MNLSEIISANQRPNMSIEWGQIEPYKKMLYAYYKEIFFSEPVAMVTNVTNNSSYIRIVESDNFTEEAQKFVFSDDIENEEDEDKISWYETINFHSKMLKDLIN